MKPWTILLQPDAEAEAWAAYLWYAALSLQAANGFQSAFDDAIGSVGEAPRMYPVFEGETRKRLFARYPYALIYTIGQVLNFGWIAGSLESKERAIDEIGSPSRSQS